MDVWATVRNDVTTLGTYFYVFFFFYIRTGLHFALIGGNLTAQKYFSTNVPNISVGLGSGVKKSDIKSNVTSTIKENTTSHENEKD